MQSRWPGTVAKQAMSTCRMFISISCPNIRRPRILPPTYLYISLYRYCQVMDELQYYRVTLESRSRKMDRVCDHRPTHGTNLFSRQTSLRLATRKRRPLSYPTVPNSAFAHQNNIICNGASDGPMKCMDRWSSCLCTINRSIAWDLGRFPGPRMGIADYLPMGEECTKGWKTRNSSTPQN